MGKIVITFVMLLALSASAAVPDGSLIEGVKPGADGRIDVLTVFPHQDDETIFVGGAIMKLKTDPRVRVHIMCLTLGDMSEANRILKITPETQGRIRSAELRAAAQVLGADEVIQLDYHDQGLEPADQIELRSYILSEITRTDAELVITYGPDGVTGHSDHKAGSKAATAAFKQSGAQRLFYVVATGSLKMPGSRGSYEPTVKVDVRPYKKMKLLAIDEHATQKWFAGFFQHMVMVRPGSFEYFALAAENKF